MWVILFTTIWLLAASAMDIKTRRIPIWLLLSGGILAVSASIYQYSGWADMWKSLLPGGMLMLIAFMTKKAGYGDGIALLCLGLALGHEKCLLLFGISLFLAAISSLALLALRKVNRNTSIPFLPFLAAAWLISLAI